MSNTDVKNDTIEYDEKSGAVRSFFGEDLFKQPPDAASNKTVGSKTTDFLELNKELFKLDNIDLVQSDKREGSVTESISYQQQHMGVPVYGARFVVGLRKEDNLVTSSVNQVDYELPAELRPEDARLSSQDAISVVRGVLGEQFAKIENAKPQLFVFRYGSPDVAEPPHGAQPIREALLKLGTGNDGQVYLVWQVLLDTYEPNGNWEFLVDAEMGKIVAVKDRRSYASRKGFVFMPDPITTSSNAALSSQTGAATLNAERREVDIDNLNTPANGNNFRLEGKWAECLDLEPPFFGHPVTQTDFKYDATDREFLSVMSYYWIDRLIEYLRGFGIPTFNQTVENKKIGLDGQGVNGDDNSHFTLTSSGKPYLAFGEGGVPDAADAHVIAHEFGHALHWYVGSRQNAQGNEEGFGDFLGGVWLDRFNTNQFQREAVFPWDNNNNIDHYSGDRFFNTPRKYTDATFGSLGVHAKGSVLAAALWDLYLRMGGNSADANVREQAADSVIHLYVEMLITMPSNATVKQLGNGLITTDQALNGGANTAHIRGAFAARGLNL